MAKPTAESDLQRFWAKVRVRPDDCWEWTAYKSPKGYGHFNTGGRKNRKQTHAHRFAYEFFVGPIPDGLQIHHACENPGCVNPDHLELVTPAYHQLQLTPGGAGYENMRKTHCPQGHPYSPANTMYKKKKTGVVGRECKVCNRIRCRERYRKNPKKYRALTKAWQDKQKGL